MAAVSTSSLICIDCEMEIDEEEQFKCSNCEDISRSPSLCIECAGAHIRKKHAVRDYRGFDPSFCQQHKRIHYYFCAQCNIFLCLTPKCSSTHNLHVFKTIKEQVLMKKTKLFEALDTLELNAKPLSDICEEIDKFESKQNEVVRRYKSLLEVDYLLGVIKPTIEKFSFERRKELDDLVIRSEPVQYYQKCKEQKNRIDADIASSMRSLSISDYQMASHELPETSPVSNNFRKFIPSTIEEEENWTKLLETDIEKALIARFPVIQMPSFCPARVETQPLSSNVCVYNLKNIRPDKKFTTFSIRIAQLRKRLFFCHEEDFSLQKISLESSSLEAINIPVPDSLTSQKVLSLVADKKLNQLLFQIKDEVFSFDPGNATVIKVSNLGKRCYLRAAWKSKLVWFKYQSGNFFQDSVSIADRSSVRTSLSDSLTLYSGGVLDVNASDLGPLLILSLDHKVHLSLDGSHIDYIVDFSGPKINDVELVFYGTSTMNIVVKDDEISTNKSELLLYSVDISGVRKLDTAKVISAHFERNLMTDVNYVWYMRYIPDLKALFYVNIDFDIYKLSLE